MLVLCRRHGHLCIIVMLQHYHGVNSTLCHMQHHMCIDWGNTYLQVVTMRQTTFTATLMDELMENLKAIADPGCSFLGMSYLQFMEDEYEWGPPGQAKLRGIHRLDTKFGDQELHPLKNCMVNLFNLRPFDAASSSVQKKVETATFKNVARCLFILDDPEWRPVALLAMRKAAKSTPKENKAS